MNILWVVNFIFPDIADELNMPRNISGGWLLDLSRQIVTCKDMSLTIVSMYSGRELRKYIIKEIQYYLIPGGGKRAQFYSKSLLKYWKQIDNDINPDVVHLHGTEFTHGEVYLDHFKNRRYLLTIQGMLGPISREATAEIPWYVKLLYRTKRELIHFNGMLEVQFLFKKNAKHEKEIIKKVQYVTGRTFWDEQLVKSINPDIRYFRCFYNLREEFYFANKWDYSQIILYTIYAGTAAQVSYKGGHIIVKAFKEILRDYPTAKLILILNLSENNQPIPNNGYQKYVLKLIRNLKLEQNVQFLSPLNSSGVIGVMQKSHCMIVGSSMENASSTLREGMHIGIPSVASYRGGMTYLIDDGVNGFFFDYPEYEYLAGRVKQIFNDPKLAMRLSKNAITKAENWHNREKNRDDYLNIYRVLMEK